jgi:hypothetical protein
VQSFPLQAFFPMKQWERTNPSWHCMYQNSY